MATFLFLSLSSASATGVAESIGVDVLREVRWQDNAGQVHEGVDGTGQPILTFEGYNRLLPAMQPCYTPGRYHLYTPWDLYPQAAGDPPRNDLITGGHGTVTNSIICAAQPSGSMRDLGGLAPGALMYSASNGGYADLSHWFSDDPPRVLTHSIGSDPIAEIEAVGGNPNSILITSSMGNSGGPIESNDSKLDPRVMRIVSGDSNRSEVKSYSTQGYPGKPSTYPSLTAPGCALAVIPKDPFTEQSLLGVATSVFAPSGPLHAIDGCPEFSFGEVLQLWLTDDRMLASGTSIAAPVVAAAAALTLQVNPGLSPAELRHVLEQTSDNFLPTNDTDDDGVISKQEFYDQHGWRAGWGYLNATRAVLAAHYLALHPGSSLEEAMQCGRLGTMDGALWLNPQGPACVRDEGRTSGPRLQDDPPRPDIVTIEDGHRPDEATPEGGKQEAPGVDVWVGMVVLLASALAMRRKKGSN